MEYLTKIYKIFCSNKKKDQTGSTLSDPYGSSDFKAHYSAPPEQLYTFLSFENLACKPSGFPYCWMDKISENPAFMRPSRLCPIITHSSILLTIPVAFIVHSSILLDVILNILPCFSQRLLCLFVKHGFSIRLADKSSICKIEENILVSSNFVVWFFIILCHFFPAAS